jgi:hypothetical protein
MRRSDLSELMARFPDKPKGEAFHVR